MATLNWQGLDELYAEMSRAGERAGEIAQQMIRARANEVLNAWKIAIGMHGHVKTGDMMKSVDFKTKRQNGMRVAEIYPMGEDRHGVRNAEKAFILHYGRSNLRGSHIVLVQSLASIIDGVRTKTIVVETSANMATEPCTCSNHPSQSEV